MNFPSGSTAPDAQNDRDASLWQKMVQSVALLCIGAGKSYELPAPKDSIYQSRFKLTQNLYNYIYT